MVTHKLGIDIDGCLANFNLAYGKRLAEANGNDLLPEGWKDKPEVFVCWNWDSHYGYTPEIQNLVWRRDIINNPTFWGTLRGYPLTVETVKKLNFMAKAGMEVSFLTNRMGLMVKQQTEKWLYDIGIDYPTVIIASDKIPIIRAMGLNFYVDDKLETCNDLARVAEGEDLPVKGRVYMVDAPYNREGRHDGVRVVGSVKEALQEAGLWR